MPNAQPPMPTTPPPLPASATGKAAGAAMSKKAIAAIVAAVLVGATGAGVGISFAAGAWGRNDKPAAAQTADDKASKKTAKTDADKSDASKKKQNDESTEKQNTESKKNERPTLRDTAKYHVSAQSYEFDLPAYWRDRVTVQVDGDDVTILSKSYPDTDNPVCSIRVEEGSQPRDVGDVSFSVVGYVTLGDSHVEVWAHRYPVISAMGRASGESDLKSDAEYTELTDLQSGGTLDFATSRSTINDDGSSSDNSAFTIDNWLKDNLVSAIHAK